MTRTCSDCPAPISRYSKGRCRPCSLLRTRTDPAIIEKRLARLRETVTTDEHRAKIRRARFKIEAERANDPAWQAMRLAGGVRIQKAYLASPEAQRKRAENHAKSAARVQIPWCPDERRGEYRILRKKVGANEARRIIEADIPGTAEHACRAVHQSALNMQLKHERELASRY
jgi:hypothetical protein